MLKLIGLELRRNNIKTYVLASFIACCVLLAFIYFVAYVAQVETGPREIQFQNYKNIFTLIGVIGLVIFSTMSAVMYTRFILSEYSGKRAALLFSYPVSRKKILHAKLLLVFTFTSVSMLVSTSIPYIIFSITESFAPIVVQDVMSMELLTEALRVLCAAVLAIGGIGIVAMRLGFIKKSVPTTLITAFLLSAVYGNAVITANNTPFGFVIGGIGIVIAVFVMIELSHTVNRMEAD